MREYEGLWDHLREVETRKEYQGYIYSVGKALTVVVLGSMCGLRSVSEIHQWATKQHVKTFLREHFGIEKMPCYYWLLCLLKLVDPESLNRCFIRWTQSMIPKDGTQLTLAFDGKAICSTDAMQGYESPLHIISAHVAELGLTLGQKTVSGKSNEIPALRDLLDLLQVKGCMVVADAMHCQKKTAQAIVEKKADYLLSAKDNQPTLKAHIEEYVQDDALRKTMDSFTTVEKNGGRVEKRSAYVTCDVDWLEDRDHWAGLACVGAIHRQCEVKSSVSSEWHYYISSRPLAAEELLRFARKGWSIESMHWLLDVHFREDFCRVEDELVQQNLNMIRKIVLNTIRQFKATSNSKRAFSKIMLDCLLEPQMILAVLQT